jgi:isoleucyl-tRNA synthetase
MLANINDLEALTPYEQMGALDKWIINEAKDTFAAIHNSFSNYNFVHGMSILNNFIVNELSGMYIDMTKDSLYCNAKNDPRRMASQSAMAMITKSLLLLMAPILTYTADEIIENAPSIIKGDAEDIFAFTYEALEGGACDFDGAFMSKAREHFGVVVDGLKKEKIIKSTLELVIATDSQKVLSIASVDAEDWFVVSRVFAGDVAEALGHFEVDGAKFVVAKATEHKCPRCWKYHSVDEETPCPRCQSVLNA